MLCDAIVLYVLKRKLYYRAKKYLYVSDPDEEVNDQVIEIRETINWLFVTVFENQQQFSQNMGWRERDPRTTTATSSFGKET